MARFSTVSLDTKLFSRKTDEVRNIVNGAPPKRHPCNGQQCTSSRGCHAMAGWLGCCDCLCPLQRAMASHRNGRRGHENAAFVDDEPPGELPVITRRGTLLQPVRIRERDVYDLRSDDDNPRPSKARRNSRTRSTASDRQESLTPRSSRAEIEAVPERVSSLELRKVSSTLDKIPEMSENEPAGDNADEAGGAAGPVKKTESRGSEKRRRKREEAEERIESAPEQRRDSDAGRRSSGASPLGLFRRRRSRQTSEPSEFSAISEPELTPGGGEDAEPPGERRRSLFGKLRPGAKYRSSSAEPQPALSGKARWKRVVQDNFNLTLDSPLSDHWKFLMEVAESFPKMDAQAYKQHKKNAVAKSASSTSTSSEEEVPDLFEAQLMAKREMEREKNDVRQQQKSFPGSGSSLAKRVIASSRAQNSENTEKSSGINSAQDESSPVKNTSQKEAPEVTPGGASQPAVGADPSPASGETRSGQESVPPPPRRSAVRRASWFQSAELEPQPAAERRRRATVADLSLSHFLEDVDARARALREEEFQQDPYHVLTRSQVAADDDHVVPLVDSERCVSLLLEDAERHLQDEYGRSSPRRSPSHEAERDGAEASSKEKHKRKKEKRRRSEPKVKSSSRRGSAGSPSKLFSLPTWARLSSSPETSAVKPTSSARTPSPHSPAAEETARENSSPQSSSILPAETARADPSPQSSPGPSAEGMRGSSSPQSSSDPAADEPNLTSPQPSPGPPARRSSMQQQLSLAFYVPLSLVASQVGSVLPFPAGRPDSPHSHPSQMVPGASTSHGTAYQLEFHSQTVQMLPSSSTPHGTTYQLEFHSQAVQMLPSSSQPHGTVRHLALQSETVQTSPGSSPPPEAPSPGAQTWPPGSPADGSSPPSPLSVSAVSLPARLRARSRPCGVRRRLDGPAVAALRESLRREQHEAERRREERLRYRSERAAELAVGRARTDPR